MADSLVRTKIVEPFDTQTKQASCDDHEKTGIQFLMENIPRIYNNIFFKLAIIPIKKIKKKY